MRHFEGYSTTFIVLLTVFVLIVAAAITKVVGNLSQNEIKRRFQGIYSVYSQALITTVNEMNDDTGCYFSPNASLNHNFANCDEFYKIFISHLNPRKYCEKDALNGGCIPEYAAYTCKNKCSGFFRSMMNKYADVFVMADGSNIIIYNETTKERKPIFAVDVNGFSKPNKAGKDLFSLTIMRNENGAYYFHSNVSYCLPVEKDGIQNLADVYK